MSSCHPCLCADDPAAEIAFLHPDLWEVGCDAGVKLLQDVLGGCEAASWILHAKVLPSHFLRLTSR